MRAVIHVDVALGGLRKHEGVILIMLGVDYFRLDFHYLVLVRRVLVLLLIDFKKVLQLFLLALDALTQHHIDVLLAGFRPKSAIPIE